MSGISADWYCNELYVCSFPQIALATGDVQEIRGAADLRRIKLKVCAMSVSGAWCCQAFEPAHGIGRGGSVCVLIQSFPFYFQIGQAYSYAHNYSVDGHFPYEG